MSLFKLMELSYSLKTHLHTKKFKREKFMFNSSNCDRKSKLLKLLDQTVRSSEETWENVFSFQLCPWKTRAGKL